MRKRTTQVFKQSLTHADVYTIKRSNLFDIPGLKPVPFKATQQTKPIDDNEDIAIKQAVHVVHNKFWEFVAAEIQSVKWGFSL